MFRKNATDNVCVCIAFKVGIFLGKNRELNVLK